MKTNYKIARKRWILYALQGMYAESKDPIDSTNLAYYAYNLAEKKFGAKVAKGLVKGKKTVSSSLLDLVNDGKIRPAYPGEVHNGPHYGTFYVPNSASKPAEMDRYLDLDTLGSPRWYHTYPDTKNLYLSNPFRDQTRTDLMDSLTEGADSLNMDIAGDNERNAIGDRSKPFEVTSKENYPVEKLKQ
jgi:hypothetical protein